jgi:hydrogenase/urease accessory protein HupE
MRLWPLVAALAVAFSVALPGRAPAHPLAPTEMTVTLGPDKADITLTMAWHLLVDEGADPEAADAYLDAQLRATGPERAAWLARLRAWLASRLHLVCDTAEVPLTIALPTLETPLQAELPTSTLPALAVEAEAALGSASRCRLRLDERLGTVVLRVRPRGPSAEDMRLLAPGEASPDYDLGHGARSTGETHRPQVAPPTPPPSLVGYIVIGFEHIVPDGLDHVLFVLALFFLGAGAKPLLWQVTAFTVAHSVTLALGLLGWAQLPDAVVEPAIAASIAFVALEDLFGDRTATRRRVAVVFLFGLLHGLGFAGALRETGLPMDRFASTLVGFNVGVELGQLAVLAAAFALTRPLARWARYEALVRRPACAAIAATGLYWTLTRLL